MSANERVLLVDGPFRGWDVPCAGAFLAIPIRNPAGSNAEPAVAHYRIDPVRSRSGEVFRLGFLDENLTWRVTASPEKGRI